MPRATAKAEPVGRAVLSTPSALDALGAAVAREWREAFTLIELILVMALLTMAVSVTAPTLSHFFRGRTLDAEARRLLSLVRSGQNRAVAEGMPVNLWVNGPQGTYGLQIEPSYETGDPKAVELSLDNGLQIQVGARKPAAPTHATASATGHPTGLSSVTQVQLVHPDLPTLRFLPDGSIDESSPEKLQLVAHDGSSLWLAQSADRLTYEIRTTDR